MTDEHEHFTLDGSKIDWSKHFITSSNNTSIWGFYNPNRTVFTIPAEFIKAIQTSMYAKDADMWLSTPSGLTRTTPFTWDEAIAEGVKLTEGDSKTPVILMHNGAGVLMALFHGGKAFIQVELSKGDTP